MGFDDLRSIRPIFEATFWPGINKVRVRFIGENCCTAALEDVACDIALTMGSANPQTVYTKAGYVHKAATRWTKVFWLGGAPDERNNVDSNLAYLVQTCFVPMYDTTLAIPESEISGDYSRWLGTARDIQDAGWWTRYMPTTGGRHDIGHMPRWSTQWLYTGDYRSKQIAFGHADLAGNWPMNVREGDPAKLYDRAQTIPAIGKPVSICAGPDLWIFDSRDATDPDWIAIQGTRLETPGGAWSPDNAHQPDPFAVQYMLTGDHWYLEQMQMWAACDALSAWPTTRGPAGYAGLSDQIRANAWVFRNRVNAAFLSPDNTAEKDYFVMLVDDIIAHWDGWHGVPGAFMQSHLWKWAKDKVGVPYGLGSVSPLHFFGWQTDTRWYYTMGVVDGGSLPWQEYFLMMELGIAREKGFATGALAAWHGQMLIEQFKDPDYYVYHLADYILPVRLTTTGTWVTSWAEARQAQIAEGHDDAEALAAFNGGIHDTVHGYSLIASAAAAQVATLAGGDPIAWDFLKANVRDANPAGLAADTKWAINPRGRILQVGTGKTYPTVQAAVDAAADWDTIQIYPGTYTGQAGWARVEKNSLSIVGIGSPRPVLDAAGSLSGRQGHPGGYRT